MIRPQPTKPEEPEPEPEPEGEHAELSAAESEKLTPEEELLRAIFGEKADFALKRKKEKSPPPPATAQSKRIAQPEPERVPLRFVFERQMVTADLAQRIVPTLDAVAQVDEALTRALGEMRGDEIQIRRIQYGSPMDVELANVSPTTGIVLHALEQNQDLTFQDQMRLKELQFQLAQEELKGAQLRNEEQALQNAKLQLEIDSFRMQQLITMFERLFPQVSEPMRLAIIAQNYPELRRLMPPNVQLLFGAGPSETSPSSNPS